MKTSRFLIAICSLLLVACGERSNTSDEAQTSSNSLVVCSYGGSFQEAQRKAFFEPFEKETGIKVIEANWSGEFAKIKSMVESDNVQWDLVTAAESSIIERGINEGILAEIDFSNIDTTKFLPLSYNQYMLGFDYYSTVLAYNEEAFADGDYPKDWKEFWDTERYPGKRSLRKDPRTTLEIALMADGVHKDSLYPLDVNRAFESLNRIKDQVVWWTSGHQPVQLMASKEVVAASVFNGRVWSAVKTDSLPLQIVWKGGALDLDSWIIPKGAKNYENAMRLVEYTTRPEVQNRLVEYISYSPTLKESYDFLGLEVRADLPTSPENYEYQYHFNGKWWSAHEAEVLDQWNAWLVDH